jgi:hypothetical protein
MAYQKKYYYSFQSLNKTTYSVEIWQDTESVITAEQVVADETAFNVSYPAIDNKFEVVRGSGCDLTLLSTTSMKFINLYTSDMQEYQIRLYLGTGTTNLLWNGYLDSELYSEPFSEKTNYRVSLTGNDGLALLERFDYLQSDDSLYNGFATNWNIIRIILLKLGLTWNNVYVGLSTTSSELSAGNILETTYSYHENYYDEDDEPMSYREVLETILKPFGAYIQIINANVYITDINNLAANSSGNFYTYNGTTLDYEGTTSITFNIGDLSDIKFASNDQTLNIISPFNKQSITSSLYIDDTLIDYDANEDFFSGLTGTLYKGSYPYTWTEKQYSISKYWTISSFLPLNQINRFRELIGTGSNKGDAEKYLVLEKTDSLMDTFTYTYKIPNIVTVTGLTYAEYVGDWVGNVYPESTYYYNSGEVVSYNSNYYLCIASHYPDSDTPPPNTYFELTNYSIVEQELTNLFQLKIEAKCYVRTTDNLGADPEANAYSAKVNSKLSIGNKHYHTGSQRWTDSATDLYLELIFKDISDDRTENEISDKWVDLQPTYVPLFNGITASNVGFEIYRYYAYASNFSDITSSTKDLRLKDIKISIVDRNLVEISKDDIEYISYLNKQVKNDSEDITLKLATNVNYLPVAKGSILGYKNSSYYHVQNFTRNGTTDIIENLLARSIIGNYSNKTVEILCTINKTNTLFGTFTYANYWNTMKFAVIGANINYQDDAIELSLQEINEDSLVIQKNY